MSVYMYTFATPPSHQLYNVTYSYPPKISNKTTVTTVLVAFDFSILFWVCKWLLYKHIMPHTDPHRIPTAILH